MEQLDFVIMAYTVAFVCLGGGGLILTLLNRRIMRRLNHLGEQ